MIQTREFPMRVILTLVTERIFSEFVETFEALTYVMGHLVYTHELQDRAVWEEVQEDVLIQHPALRDLDASDVTPDNCDAYLRDAIENYGKSLVLKKGSKERKETPEESFRRIHPDAIGLIVKPSEIDRN